MSPTCNRLCPLLTAKIEMPFTARNLNGAKTAARPGRAQISKDKPYCSCEQNILGGTVFRCRRRLTPKCSLCHRRNNVVIISVHVTGSERLSTPENQMYKYCNKPFVFDGCHLARVNDGNESHIPPRNTIVRLALILMIRYSPGKMP